jgi:hypothetical protein
VTAGRFLFESLAIGLACFAAVWLVERLRARRAGTTGRDAPTRRWDWFRFPHASFMPLVALVLGASLLNLLAEVGGLGTPPPWSRVLAGLVLPLVGLLWLVDPPTGPDAARIGRVFGAVLLLLGAASTAHDISRLPSPPSHSPAE